MTVRRYPDGAEVEIEGLTPQLPGATGRDDLFGLLIAWGDDTYTGNPSEEATAPCEHGAPLVPVADEYPVDHVYERAGDVR
jgi:hypothetical protein